MLKLTQNRDGQKEEPASDNIDWSLVKEQELFSLMSNRRRRLVLDYLTDERQATLTEVTDYLAGLENGTPISQVDNDKRKSIYNSLKQTHLPKLDKQGLIEYDDSQGSIELLDQGERVAANFLQSDSNDHSFWEGFAFTLSLCSIFVFSLYFLSVVEQLTPAVIFSLGLLLFISSSLTFLLKNPEIKLILPE
jgi:hypothetical protein